MAAIGTDVETVSSPTPTSTTYISRPGAQIWSFRRSRDRWKRKYQELKVSVKRYKNRVADVTKSREQWKLKAQEAAARLAALEAEAATLQAEIATREKKPSCTPPR